MFVAGHGQAGMPAGHRGDIGDDFILSFPADDVTPAVQQASGDNPVFMPNDGFKCEMGTGHGENRARSCLLNVHSEILFAEPNDLVGDERKDFAVAEHGAGSDEDGGGK